MKNTLILAVLLLLPMAGCRPAATSTPANAVAPGYSNLTDQQIGGILASAHNFLAGLGCAEKAQGYSTTTFQCEPAVTVTKFVPTTAELTTLNALEITVNSAQTVYLAYHAGTATLAQAQAAANQVKSQQATIQTAISAEVK